MNEPRYPAFLWAGVVAVAFLASYACFQRYRAEQRNLAVGIAVDYDVTRALGASQGLNPADSLTSMKSSGAQAVVLSEETVGSLIADARLLDDGKVFRGAPADLERVRRGISIRFPGATFERGDGLKVSGLPRDLIRATSVGLEPEAVTAAANSGLEIIGRYGNPTGVSEEAVKDTLRWAKEQGVVAFLPQGEQVLGRRDALGALVDTLKERGIAYASPEFAKIGGDANVVQAAPEIIVRLHSAQAQEMDKMGPVEAVERFVKAARERNQRYLLVRPLTNSAAEPLAGYGKLITDINDGLKAVGMVPGKPHATLPPEVPAWALMGLSVAIGIVAIGFFITHCSNPTIRILGILFLAGIALAATRESFRGIQALIGAMVFPLLGFAVVVRKPMNWLAGFAIASVLSLIGGLCVAGLLSALPYAVKADEFSGVKIAHFLPVFLAGGWMYLRTFGKESLDSPIRWSGAIMAILGMAVLLLIVSRTGNDNPAAVSGTELRFRALLDALLPVRPRSKEFMLGHPAMIVGLGMLAASRHEKRWAGWAVALLAVGMIGQTSIVNTLVHLHSPVALAVLRIGTGWVVGGIIGGLVYALVKRRTQVREVA